MLRRLSAIAAQGQAAIDQDRLAGNVIVLFKKKSHGSRHIFRPPKAANRAARDMPVVLSRLHAGRGHAGNGGSRRNDIHSHMIPLLRQNTRRMHQSSLRRGVIHA